MTTLLVVSLTTRAAVIVTGLIGLDRSPLVLVRTGVVMICW